MGLNQLCKSIGNSAVIVLVLFGPVLVLFGPVLVLFGPVLVLFGPVLVLFCQHVSWGAGKVHRCAYVFMCTVRTWTWSLCVHQWV